MTIVFPVRSIRYGSAQPDATWGNRINLMLDMSPEDCREAIRSMAESMPASKFWGIFDEIKAEENGEEYEQS